jgi:hypothetical protein
MPYLLSSKLRISSTDIRAVCPFTYGSETYVACGDRNGILYTIRVCPEGLLGITTAVSACTRAVSSIAYVKQPGTCADGGLIIGSHDGSCSLWSIATLLTAGEAAKPVKILQKHDKEVCFVGSLSNGESVITSSWDKTVRIFSIDNIESCIQISHPSFSIWAVADTSHGFVSAGADGQLKMWSATGHELATYPSAHGAPIRDAKCISRSDILLTIANDGLLKEWEIDAHSIDPVRETIVTNTYLYTLDILNPKTTKCAAAGDQGFVFIVEKGKLVDFYPFSDPVWSLAHLPNGDIVAGCSSGTIAVLTEDAARRAPPEVEAAHLASLAAKRINIERYQAFDVAALPEFGTGTNRKLGQPVLMRAGDEKVLGLWVPCHGRWLQYGTLGHLRVQDGQGNEWDAKLEIAIEDQKLPLFLNRGESPWAIAHRFLRDQRLPLRRLAPLAELLAGSAAAVIGPSARPSGLGPVFGEAQEVSAESFPEGERAAANPEGAAELFRGKIERGESVTGDHYLAVLRNMALARSLPADAVRQIAGALAGGDGVHSRSAAAVLFMCDAFRNYPEEVIDALQTENVVPRAGKVLDELEMEMKAALLNLMFNYACYSVHAPATLAEVAEALATLSVKSLGTLDNAMFVQACHVCVQYSADAVEKLKIRADVIKQVEIQTDRTRELLADVTARLEQ